MNQLRTAVAFVFQRAGRDALTEQEIRHHVSMDLRWFEPDEARRFVEQALDRELLEPAEDGLSPTFTVRDVEVPLGFQPDLPTREATPMDRLLDRLEAETGRERQDLVAEINGEQDRFGDLVDPIVAGFLVARDLEVDVDDLLEGYLGEQTVPDPSG